MMTRYWRAIAEVVLLALLPLGLMPSTASAAVSFVQSTYNDTGGSAAGGSVAATFTNPVTTHNLIAVLVTWGTATNDLTSVTDSLGNTYAIQSAFVLTDGGNSQTQAVAYAKNIAGGTNTVTANFSTTPGWRAIAIHEISGADLTAPLDGVTGLFQTSVATTANAVTSGSITTTANGDYIFGATVNTSGFPTITAGTSPAYTIRTNNSPNSNVANIATEDRVQSTAGSIAATFTVNVTGQNMATFIMAFKPPTCAAVSDATYVAANAQNAQATVYWSSANPVVILRKTSAFSTEAPTSLTTYSVGNTGGSLGTAVVQYVGSATSFNQGSLTNGTTYYYKVFANSSACYSPGLAVNATPSAGAAAPAWSYATLATSMAPPGLDPWSSVVIAGSNDNKLHGMSGSTGTLAFAPFTTGGPIQGRPAILPAAYSTTGVKIAYVTSQDGFAYAVNTSTGAQVWKSALLGTTLQGGANVWLQAIKSLTFAGGVTSDVVIVGTSNTGNATSNKVYALNGNTGATVWTFSPGNMDIISSTSQVDFTNNTVWVTSRSNSGSQPSVWKLNAQTGALITSWNNANLGDIDSAPVSSSDGTFVYVGTNAGKLNAIRVSDGALFTHTPGSGAGALKGMPWPLSWTAIGVATPDTIIFTRNSTVHSVNFDGSTFSANWTTTLTGTPTVSAPVDDGANHLYIGASDGKVHQLDVLTGADQKQVSIAGLDIGFNFRNTQAYVTDGANETYVLSTDTYPTTRNGVTFGWVADAITISAFDASTGVDRRLAGINYVTNGAGKKQFRVDLPAPGTYSISLALGTAGFAITSNTVEIRDNTTVLTTISGNTASSNFLDASGVNQTAANWPSQNVAIQETFATTTFNAAIGTTSGTGNSTLAHLRIVHGGVGTPTVGDPTFNVNLNAIHVGATDGHIYTFTTPF